MSALKGGGASRVEVIARSIAPGAQFASDNNAGLCPEALEAFLAANAAGHTNAYGDDPFSAAARAKIAEVLGAPEAVVHFVFNGTAANSLALAHLARSYEGVICHAVSHINTDECAAPEFLSGGSKLFGLEGAAGKLDPAAVERFITSSGRGVHFPALRVLSITQSTEMGTLYTPAEIAALAKVAHARGLKVHMDGARLANAVASLSCDPADLTWRAGVDVLSFGATKNGLGLGEAVVWFDKAAAQGFDRRLKQAGQLDSKMRLMSAPWLGLIEGGVWLKNARHANAMAERLAAGLATAKGVVLMFPRQANAVFAKLPPALQEKLRKKGWRFHTFLPPEGCRLMCAFDTAPETIDRFVADVAEAAAS